MRTPAILAAFAVMASCATPAAELDSDPNTLQIEIGRYSALLGQVSEYAGVSYDHVGRDATSEGPDALMQQLREAVADYNALRRALCESRSGASAYIHVRAQSCTSAFCPGWGQGSVTYDIVARRSRAAGAPIIGLWSAVCEEARSLEKDPDVMVCPME